jgi:4,5-dihydroxyphthalate decarboxylase
MPLALGDVRPSSFDLELVRLDQTPDLLTDDAFDAAETSFSRYTLGRAAGEDRLVGLPAFVMSGFRHRCVITRRDSGLTSLAELRGRRVGLTGWPDSGNTWTRAVVRRAGVAQSDVEWFVGPLMSDHPVGERIGPRGAPANVARTPGDRSLVELLLAGELDAVMTPFMPPGFHEPGSPLRHLIPDYRAAEAAYFAEVGYVPGIHLITVRREVAERHPGVTGELMAALEASRRTWLGKRLKLADTTPWLLAELDITAKTVGLDWTPYGAPSTDAMTAAFCEELFAQDLTDAPVDPGLLFADYAELGSAV